LLVKLAQTAEALAQDLADRATRQAVPASTRNLAHAPGLYALFYRVQDALLAATEAEAAGRPIKGLRATWAAFGSGWRDLIDPLGPCDLGPPEHIFALFFQVRRAFVLIFDKLYGTGPAAAELRAQVWQSAFTHVPRRYARSLTTRMDDLPTLILGESGTGKEVVARALAGGRFRAFDPSSATFAPPGAFEAMNLAAVPTTLVESELFGHCRGSFTGAVSDRAGRLEHLGIGATALLDEVGDLDGSVQVKLLRVLQERSFSRVGEDRVRTFEGKVIAATHRDLAALVEEGAFRADLYYRLAGDVIRTPPLRDLVAGDRAELLRLIRLVTSRMFDAGRADDAEDLAEQAVEAIESGPGMGHDWPGNFRELEQCLRSVMVRGRYEPRRRRTPGGLSATFEGMRRCELTADSVLSAYCGHAVEVAGGYEPAARLLGLDRRTVKAKAAANAGG
jgi:DNA-binding NtrC family response regulator